MSREQFEKPYEALKAATRGKPMDRDTMLAFIDSLQGITPAVRAELRTVTPQNFNGVFDIDAHYARRRE